jgi:hypothetical protein
MGHLQTQSVYSIRQSCGYEQISSIIDMAPDPTEYEDHSEQSGDLRHGRLPLEGHTAKGF